MNQMKVVFPTKNELGYMTKTSKHTCTRLSGNDDATGM